MNTWAKVCVIGPKVAAELFKNEGSCSGKRSVLTASA